MGGLISIPLYLNHNLGLNIGTSRRFSFPELSGVLIPRRDVYTALWLRD